MNIHRITGEINADQVNQAIQAIDKGTTKFVLSSSGGSLPEAMRLVDAIKDASQAITIAGSGTVGSAAIPILASARTSISYPTTLYHTHKSELAANGNEADLREATSILDIADAGLRNALSHRVSPENLDVLYGSSNEFFDAKRAKEVGLVDDIVEPTNFLELELRNPEPLPARPQPIFQTTHTVPRLSNRDAMIEALTNRLRGQPSEHNPYASSTLDEIKNEVAGDFPKLLKESVQRVATEQFQSSMERVPFVSQRTVPDFKEATIANFVGFPSLLETAESAEIEYTHSAEASFTLTVKTFAARFALSRQAVVNNNTGPLQIYQELAKSAARTVGDEVYDRLQNGKSYDGTALFSSGHSNVDSGTTVNLSTVYAGMLSQSRDSIPAPASPMYALCAPGTISAVRAAVASELNTTNGGANVDRYLPIGLNTNSIIGEYRIKTSTRSFYFDTDAVLQFTIEGMSAPSFDSREEFSTGDIQFRCIYDFAVIIPDHTKVYQQG